MSEFKKTYEERFQTAELRRSKFQEAIPKELNEREDAIRKVLSRENSSSRSKLKKVYNLMNEIIEVAKPFTACGKGCSDCCNQNVMISETEAKFITEAISTQPIQLESSIIHDEKKFLGVACTFLKNNACSIYDVRPYTCRKHLSFDEDAYLCHPSRSIEHKSPMIVFSEAEGAMTDIGRYVSGGVFADIRDFFPNPFKTGINE